MMNILGKSGNKYWPFFTFCAFSLVIFFLPHSVFAVFGLPAPMDMYLYVIKLGYLIGVNIILRLAGLLVWFGAILIDIFLNQELYNSVLGTRLDGDRAAIRIGWEVIRDFCNMFYVFFLLLIAFATITRNSSYSAKNLLPKIIISMLLINFSMVIAKVVIDFGQVFLFGIAGWMGSFAGTGGAGTGLTSITDYFESQFTSNLNPSLPALFLASFAIFYTFLLALLYVMLALFLLIRLIYFVFLVVVSPFAFFSMVLPSMQNYSSKWWHALVQNSISGPIFIFFVYLATTMASTLQYMTPIPINPELGYWQNFLVVIIPHIVSIGMLWMAIPATQALGAAGSKQIIGGAFGLGNVAMGMYATSKIAEKGVKKGYKAIEDRSPSLANKREGVQKSIAQFKGNLGLGGAALNTMKNIDQNKQDKLDEAAKKFGPKESIDLDFAKGIEGLTTAQKNYIAIAAIERGKGKEFEKWLDMDSLSEKDRANLLMKKPDWAYMTSDAKVRVANGGYSKEAEDRINADIKAIQIKDPKINNNDALKEARMNEEKFVWTEKAALSNKEKEIQGDSVADPVVFRALTETISKAGMNDYFKSITNKSKKANVVKGAVGYADSAIGDRSEHIDRALVAMSAGADANIAFGKDLKDSLGQLVLTQDEFLGRVEEGFGQRMTAKTAVNVIPDNFRQYGYLLQPKMISGLATKREPDSLNAVAESLNNRIDYMKNDKAGNAMAAAGGVSGKLAYQKQIDELEKNLGRAQNTII
jgi:hypothetical protein